MFPGELSKPMKVSSSVSRALDYSTVYCIIYKKYLGRYTFEPPRGKTNNVVSEQVLHKPTCTSTEISDLSRRANRENKGADQLRGYCEADLCLCFRLCRLLIFPWGGSFNYILVHTIYINKNELNI